MQITFGPGQLLIVYKSDERSIKRRGTMEYKTTQPRRRKVSGNSAWSRWREAGHCSPNINLRPTALRNDGSGLAVEWDQLFNNISCIIESAVDVH